MTRLECRRVLAEHADTKVLLCSRDGARGEAAAAELGAAFSPARVVLVHVTPRVPAITRLECLL